MANKKWNESTAVTLVEDRAFFEKEGLKEYLKAWHDLKQQLTINP
jgi:hypothetical protein